jgi:hypothetical protein
MHVPVPVLGAAVVAAALGSDGHPTQQNLKTHVNSL